MGAAVTVTAAAEVGNAKEGGRWVQRRNLPCLFLSVVERARV